MKIHHLILIVLCNISFIGWSQTQEHHVISLPEMRILYRGYVNKIEYSTPKGYDTVFLVTNENSGIQINPFNSNSSTVKVSADFENFKISIRSLGVKNNDTIELATTNFDIKSPPIPYLFWGNCRSDQHLPVGDSTFYSSRTRIWAAFSPDTPLTAKFSIRMFEVQVGIKTYNNYGSVITSSIWEKIHASPKGTMIRIQNVSATGPMGKFSVSPPFYHIKTSNE